MIDPTTTPGYEFGLRQGERALDRLISRTTGGGLSGEAIKAAEKFGQDYASSQVARSIAMLEPTIARGAGARQNIAQNVAGLGQTKAGIRFSGVQSARPPMMPNMEGQADIAKANVESQFWNNLLNLGVNLGTGMYMNNLLNPGTTGKTTPQTFSTPTTPTNQGYGYMPTGVSYL